jgi:predicted alpha/beta-hydrolase family hydrolase
MEPMTSDGPNPLLLFAPGAGAPSSHPWMQAWKQRLGGLGSVETFDYDYMAGRRGRPDPLPVLIARHRQALAETRQLSRPTILIGKSMGGRIGCHVALEEAVAGVVCLSYPLCGGGDPTKLRDEVLRELRTPILFVQGTRDSLCPLDLLERVRVEMKAPNSLHLVDGGDHSLQVPKRQLAARGETQEDVDRRILEAITEFVTQQLNPD